MVFVMMVSVALPLLSYFFSTTGLVIFPTAKEVIAHSCEELFSLSLMQAVMPNSMNAISMKLQNVFFVSILFIVRNKPIYKTVQNYEQFLHLRSVKPDFNGFYGILREKSEKLKNWKIEALKFEANAL